MRDAPTWRIFFLAIGGFLSGLATPAWAQVSDDATAAAADAFGERVGLEEVGLYSSSQIRGFNPENSGAYRIDGAYFARAGWLADGVMSGVGVRVGVNAARANYPSPSGLVDYHLRSYGREDFLSVGAGTYYYYSPVLDLDFGAASSEGHFGLTGGINLHPAITYGDSSRGEENSIGIVPEWRPSEHLRARGVLSYGRIEYASGFWGNFVSGAEVPRAPPLQQPLPPERAHSTEEAINVGLLVDATPSPNWRVVGSAIFSQYDTKYQYTSFERDLTPFLHVTLTDVPQQLTRASALELSAARDSHIGTTVNRLSLALRHRHKDVANSIAASSDLGIINTDDPAYPTWSTTLDDGSRAHDIVEQTVASVDYSVLFAQRLELRTGVDFTHYVERFEPIVGTTTRSAQDFTFPHFSAIYTASDRLTLFSSYVRGLEDSGISPPYAINGNEVLAPVLAIQSELGLSFALTPSLTLIAAGFEIQKPIAGLRPDGIYSFVGDVRHRGLELSLSGQATPSTRIVFGAVHMEQLLSGPLVDAGIAGEHPVGVSPSVVSASIVQTLPFAPEWSLDAQLRWSAGRYIDTANHLRSEPITSLNIGARRRFYLGETAAIFRVAATNILNVHAWDVHSGGAMYAFDRPTIWMNLSVAFGGGDE